MAIIQLLTVGFFTYLCIFIQFSKESKIVMHSQAYSCFCMLELSRVCIQSLLYFCISLRIWEMTKEPERKRIRHESLSPSAAITVPGQLQEKTEKG